jgi:hypothetical protein
VQRSGFRRGKSSRLHPVHHLVPPAARLRSSTLSLAACRVRWSRSGRLGADRAASAGPLWPCSLRGRSRARVLDIPPRHFLADLKDSARSAAPQNGHRQPLRVRGAKGTLMSPDPAASDRRCSIGTRSWLAGQVRQVRICPGWEGRPGVSPAGGRQRRVYAAYTRLCT